MFLLDTDSYTHLRLANARLLAQFAKAAAGDAVIGITIITKIEVLRGRLDGLLKADNPRRFLIAQQQLLEVEADLQRILVVPMNEAALDHFERLKSTRGLKKIGRADLLIASIVLAHDATLVSRNLKHFRLIADLHLENWVD